MRDLQIEISFTNQEKRSKSYEKISNLQLGKKNKKQQPVSRGQTRDMRKHNGNINEQTQSLKGRETTFVHIVKTRYLHMLYKET